MPPASVGIATNPAPAPTGKRGFMAVAANRSTASDERIAPPVSPYIVQAGSVIPAALITGIQSDLPGQIAAQVTQNVYDSPTGRSAEPTSELTSLMRNSYAVFWLK